MLQIASYRCSRLAACPISSGLPNCLTVIKEGVAIGTTNGQVYLFDGGMNIMQINDLHEDGVGELITSINSLGNLVISGSTSGTINVWGNSKPNKMAKSKVITLSDENQ